MKRNLISTARLLFLLFAFVLSCDDGPGTPKVTTLEATNISEGSAETGGNIKSEGDTPVTERGVVWDTKPGPTIDLQTRTLDGTGGGSFKSFVAPLVWVTKYYVRAYATNSIGTSYGNEIEFTTTPTAPILETNPVSDIGSTTAVGSGMVISDGGAPVTARGILWSTANEFNIDFPKTAAGSGTGSFSANITGLQPNTKYYVFAYGQNSVGFAPGNAVTFTTRPTEPTKVFFFDAVASPTDFESVTIKNNSGATVNLAGWTIGDLINPTAYTIPVGTTLAQGEKKLFLGTMLGFAINDSGETLYLKNAAGVTVDTWSN